MTEYVVVKTHNFDAETEATKFDSMREAIAYLHWYWEDYLNEEFAAGTHIDEDNTYHEEDYARVQWDDGDYTEFHLIELYPPREEFSLINLERYAEVF